MRISDWSSDVCSSDLTMLRIHLMQQWFGYSDPAMEEALYEIAPLRHFSKLTLLQALPDETTILTFRRLLTRDGLAASLFNTINAHLSAPCLLPRPGTMDFDQEAC